MPHQLKDIAIHLQIEASQSVEKATKINTITKVLSNIHKSYHQFVEVMFMKNAQFKKAYKKNPRVLDSIQEDMQLLLVNLSFNGFVGALSPDLTENQVSLFKDDVKEWKYETFSKYRDTIIKGCYEDIQYIQQLVEEYDELERIKIFQPLFAAIDDGSDYKINIQDAQGKTLKVLRAPNGDKIRIFLPKAQKERKATKEKTVLAYLKVRTDGNLIDLNKKRNIRDVYYFEELEHETYPFKPDMLKIEEIVFVLNQRLNCSVVYADECYFIRCDELDISVWGATRTAAEEAFAFQFYSLYRTFVPEEDRKLSAQGNQIKSFLNQLIKTVLTDEAEVN